MEITLKNGAPFDTQRLFLGSTPVGVFDAQIELNDVEKKRIIDFCRMIWGHLMNVTGNPEFSGLIRLDLIPEFLEDGTINPKGIYEINAHSPECIAVAAALGQKWVIQLLVDQIKKSFGDQQIAFVAGKCAAKDAWGGILFDMLRECGLNIVRMSEREVMSQKPQRVWRWGDTRTEPGDASHFSDEFSSWMLENRSSVIFNTLLPTESDFSRKSHLRSSDNPDVSRVLGENRALKGFRDILWSLWKGHKGFVIKPDGGASGNDIYFGEKMSALGWAWGSIKSLIRGNRSIWEARWLPGRDNYVFDVSPAFWAHNGEIHPLYTLVRVDRLYVYEERRTINVAQGAGVAEMIPF
jgi:hypothetical protein